MEKEATQKTTLDLRVSLQAWVRERARARPRPVSQTVVIEELIEEAMKREARARARRVGVR